MKVPKASDVLADELRERILSGEYAEGMGLPPERDLVMQTRMSRTSVREALRILEVQGLLRIKAGRAGGAFVVQPDGENLASTVGLLIRGRRIRLAALLETREAIEPFCAELAATHRTEDELEALEATNRILSSDESTLEEFLLAYTGWHVAVARASHNELLSGLMAGLARAIYTATDDEKSAGIAERRATARAHVTITNAIRDGDAAAAGRRMSRHVHSYAALVLKDDRQEIELA